MYAINDEHRIQITHTCSQYISYISILVNDKKSISLKIFTFYSITNGNNSSSIWNAENLKNLFINGLIRFAIHMHITIFRPNHFYERPRTNYLLLTQKGHLIRVRANPWDFASHGLIYDFIHLYLPFIGFLQSEQMEQIRVY